MFFVWTPNGGSLQYVGLGLFVLQIIPRMLPDTISPATLLALAIPVALICITMHSWAAGHLPVRQLVAWRESMRERLSYSLGATCSNMGVYMLASVLFGGIITLLLLMDAYWLSFLSQVMALGVAIYTHFYSYGPGAAQGGRRPRAETSAEREERHAKMKSIAEQIQNMPVEPFVPQEDIYSKSSIVDLKRMLERRGVTEGQLKSIKDRKNLEELIEQERRYSDTCCICFETYEPGEPLRVLTRCHHELHLECLDKWAYTFAAISKRHQDPSCPLCKGKL